MKLIVYVETGLGGTRAWINTDDRACKEALVVLSVDPAVCGEEEAEKSTQLFSTESGFDGDLEVYQLAPAKLEQRILTEYRADIKRRIAKLDEDA